MPAPSYRLRWDTTQTDPAKERANLVGQELVIHLRCLRDEGLKKVQVAERLGLHRDSVAKYWEGPALPAEPPRYRQRPRKIDRYAEYITARLARWPDLTAERLYQEIRQQGYTGSRRSVRRFVERIRPHPVREYKPLETLPGEQAQVDWGHFGTLVVEGARVRLYAFLFTLSWSRVLYVEFIPSLAMATLAACLHRAFTYVGGVPRTVLSDYVPVNIIVVVWPAWLCGGRWSWGCEHPDPQASPAAAGHITSTARPAI